MTLLEIIRKNKFATATAATVATYTEETMPTVAKVASVAVASCEDEKNDQFKFVKKSADIVDFKREERRLKVLAILSDNPETQRAFFTDNDSDPDNVILTIAIRNQYSFEMAIPKDKYDPFLLMEMIENGSTQ